MAAIAEDVDGRRRRRAHNRQAVLDVLVDLFAEGVYQPSTGEIAERAGISARSLFRYFDDVDDLHRAAIEQQHAAARPLFELPPIDPDEPLATRIQHLVEARVRLFEAVAPGARAVRAGAHRHPLVADQLRDGRRQLREQIERTLRPELVAGGSRAALLASIDALLSFETHQLLRVDHRLSAARTVDALVRALIALLARPEERA